MRGEVDPQSSMFHYFSVESRIQADHPLRPLKKLADSALSSILAELDGLYAKGGWPSIPLERLLKAQLLIAFYSVRSDRQFCEQLEVLVRSLHRRAEVLSLARQALPWPLRTFNLC